MAAIETNGIPPDVLADLQAVADHVARGKPLDPEVARRVTQRGQQITERIRRKYGVVDIAVPAIRQLRGDLPEP